MTPTRVAVVDNDDSFVHTLCDYLAQAGAHVDVVRSHDVADHEVHSLVVGHDAVLVSPGPGTPETAGVSLETVRVAARTGTPLLGVCLGHQALAAAYGATVAVAPELVHGMTSEVAHDGLGLFEGLSDPFTATRYHSLAVVEHSLPSELRVTARTSDGTVMGLRHRDLPLEGVQFHPESILTEGGHRLLRNWLDGSLSRSSR